MNILKKFKDPYGRSCGVIFDLKSEEEDFKELENRISPIKLRIKIRKLISPLKEALEKKISKQEFVKWEYLGNGLIVVWIKFKKKKV